MIVYEKSRFKNFNDAVYSIALTLLVLDIDVPNSLEIREIGFSAAMQNRIGPFIGFFVSFMVIALFWKGHVRNVSHAKFIDNKLIVINTFSLLFIALLPFSTGLFVNNYNLDGPFRFYCLNIVAIGLMSILTLRYIYKSHISEGTLSLNQYRNYLFLAINVTIVWLIACLIVGVYPTIARLIFLLIFVVDAIINRYFRNKN